MRRKIVLVLVFIMICLVSMSSLIYQLIALLTTSLTIQSSGAIIHETRPLHVEGRYIKDDLNNTIILRGVNFQGYSEDTRGRWPYEGCTTPLGPFDQWNDDWARYNYLVLRDQWGANCMRWVLTMRWWIENTDNYRYYVRRGIELAQEYGIYVILAPWRLSDVDWNHGCMLFYPYDQHQIGGRYFYEQDFIDFWVSVATELGDLPNWLIDPCNEPHYQTVSSNDADRAVWFNVVSRLILAVRPICSNIVLAQWTECEWYGSPTDQTQYWVAPFISYLEGQGAATNVVISVHNYVDHFTYMGWGGARPNTLEQLRQEYTATGLKDAATAINYPLISGEIGCPEETEGYVWYNNTLTLFNEWGIGYLGWVWARQGDGRYYALVLSGPWNQGPSEAGQILMDAIKRGRA